ncbi:MAG: RluA family pseudouridine synthase [Desulfovibrionales bacterium]|nr:RluA family pseudouridine synthase [Desulfovibrionales bacterium]
MTQLLLSSDSAPMRLDYALARSLGLGLRRCRALIEEGRVLVDGRVLRKGDLVHPGQTIILDDAAASPDILPGPPLPVIANSGRFAALLKPRGMHSAAGAGPQSVEVRLPSAGFAGWRLVNRLDQSTSGLVLAAATREDERAYKGWQEQGLVRKYYLAVAHGAVGPMELRGRILDDRRRVVRVTGEPDHPLRSTLVRPVREEGGLTLVLVRILKGRRHQIRAHMAHAGHPLLGDPLYGQAEPGGLFLHHWRVDMPGFSAMWLPDWPGVDPAQAEAVRLSFPNP